MFDKRAKPNTKSVDNLAKVLVMEPGAYGPHPNTHCTRPQEVGVRWVQTHPPQKSKRGPKTENCQQIDQKQQLFAIALALNC
jgi:hypothetical protein